MGTQTVRIQAMKFDPPTIEIFGRRYLLGHRAYCRKHDFGGKDSDCERHLSVSLHDTPVYERHGRRQLG